MRESSHRVIETSSTMKFTPCQRLACPQFMVDVFEVRFVVIGRRSFLGREALQARLPVGVPLREIASTSAITYVRSFEVALRANVTCNSIGRRSRVATIEEELDEPARGRERLLDRLEHRDRNNLAGALEDCTHEREAGVRASVDQQSAEDDEVLSELREVRAIGFYRRGTSVP